MGPFYIFVITVAVGIVALLRFLQGKQKNSTTGHGDSIFAAFKNNYVLVYSLVSSTTPRGRSQAPAIESFAMR